MHQWLTVMELRYINCYFHCSQFTFYWINMKHLSIFPSLSAMADEQWKAFLKYHIKQICACYISDPYAHVSFLHRSKTTEIIHSTLNPTWDETLIFDEIEIYGDPQMVAQNPPLVVVELFDNDQVVGGRFSGFFLKHLNNGRLLTISGIQWLSG